MPESQRLLDICKDVSRETDSNKLADLVTELNKELEEISDPNEIGKKRPERSKTERNWESRAS